MPCPDCERMLTEICKDGRGTGGAVTDGLVRPEEAFRPYGARFFLLVSVKTSVKQRHGRRVAGGGRSDSKSVVGPLLFFYIISSVAILEHIFLF